MKTKKITFKLDRAYIESHESNELWYEGGDIITYDSDQKKKLIQFVFDNLESFDLEKTEAVWNFLMLFDPISINISIMEWFAALKKDEGKNNPHLWEISLQIRIPDSILEASEVGREIKKNARNNGEEDVEIACFSKYAQIDEIKSILKQLTPEFEIEYIEPSKFSTLQEMIKLKQLN